MIITDYKSHIEDFQKYLQDKLDGISNIEGNNSYLYKKILYLSFFDSLAACVYPNIKSNKERFISLIDKFSDWENKDKICTTNLAQMLALFSHPNFEKIRKLVNDKLILWEKNISISRRENKPILISEDFTFDDLKKYWQNQNKDNLIVPFKLEDFNHSNMLYGLRNILVHQFQAKNQLNYENSDFPLYVVVGKFNFENEKIEPLRIDLIHPNSFLKKLCQSTLDNCIKYFAENNLNPFPTYFAGDYLNNKLNGE